MKVTTSHLTNNLEFESLTGGTIVCSAVTRQWYFVVKDRDIQGLVSFTKRGYNGANFLTKEEAEGSTYSELPSGESITLENDDE